LRLLHAAHHNLNKTNPSDVKINQFAINPNNQSVHHINVSLSLRQTKPKNQKIINHCKAVEGSEQLSG
jgi:hypothetical protein